MTRAKNRIAISIFEGPNRQRQRPRPARPTPGQPSRPDDLGVTQSHRRALQNMRSLVGHVTYLLNHPVAKKVGATAWLDQVSAALDAVEFGIDAGYYAPPARVTIEDEGPADLDHALCAENILEFGADWPETPEAELLFRLIDYWLREIRSRGYDLVHLLIGAVAPYEVSASFDALDRVRFPSIE